MTEDPTRIEARLRGALREITPAMREDWARADRRERARRVLVGVVVAVVLIVAWLTLRGLT